MTLMPATMTLQVPEDPQLRIDFSVSLNEEHVTLHVSTQLATITLGERAHHYSLLALARLRLRDARRDLDPTSQGWIETAMLAHSLGMDIAHLNIHIFRARSQFRQVMLGTCQGFELIERRRSELRFGSYCFQIVRGSAVEGVFLPTLPAMAIKSPTNGAGHVQQIV